MKRVFPTQLKVVSNVTDLNEQEEGNLGYYEQTGKYSMQIGTRKNRIYFNSPNNWYKSYQFTILTLPSTNLDNDTEEGECTKSVWTTTSVLWKIIAAIVKTECGRKVLHQDGDRYVTVPCMTRDQIDQMYHITKHVLKRLKVSYTKQSSWRAPPFSRTDIVIVKEKTRRRRK